MEEFRKIDNAHIILYTGGTYVQCHLYRRMGEIFAKFGQGYIGLRVNKSTTKSKVTWVDISIEYREGKFGHLLIQEQESRKFAESDGSSWLLS